VWRSQSGCKVALVPTLKLRRSRASGPTASNTRCRQHRLVISSSVTPLSCRTNTISSPCVETRSRHAPIPLHDEGPVNQVEISGRRFNPCDFRILLNLVLAGYALCLHELVRLPRHCGRADAQVVLSTGDGAHQIPHASNSYMRCRLSTAVGSLVVFRTRIDPISLARIQILSMGGRGPDLNSVVKVLVESLVEGIMYK
jgi:hypothetical protein